MVLAGGTENMSMAPHVVRFHAMALKLGHAEFTDSLKECLYDPKAGCEMAITAENLGQKYGISRADADEYGLRSQQAWLNAHEQGYYDAELCSVTKQSRRGDVVVDVDEHHRLLHFNQQNEGTNPLATVLHQWHACVRFFKRRHSHCSKCFGH